MDKLTEREKDIYWKGYEHGKKKSLEHNKCLINCQLKAQREQIRDLKKQKKYLKKQKTQTKSSGKVGK